LIGSLACPDQVEGAVGRASREDAKETLPTGRGPSDFPASAGVGDCIAVFRRFEEKNQNAFLPRRREELEANQEEANS